MGKYNKISTLICENGNYRKVKGSDESEMGYGKQSVQHYQIENFTEDLPRILTKLFDKPNEVLLTWSTKLPHNRIIPSRSKTLLGHDYSESLIGIIDIDEVDSKPIRDDGRPLEEQVNSILEEHLPHELYYTSRVVKMSSSWATNRAIKFHVFFSLSEPIQHGVWASYCKNNIPIADKSLSRNAGQMAFSARPKGVDLTEQAKIFTFEGDELFVCKKKYTSTYKIRRDPFESSDNGIKLRDTTIKEKVIDVSSDSHIRSFWAYVDAISSGNSPVTLKQMNADLIARGGKVADRVVNQSKSAIEYVEVRCRDPFYGIRPAVLPNGKYIGLSDLVPNKDGKTINLIKGTTGIGKTQAMTGFCEGKSSLVVGQTRLLVHQNADDFNAYPVDMDVPNGADLSEHCSISTTIHSLHKVTERMYEKPFDVLFIDESHQSIKSWLEFDSIEKKQKALEPLALGISTASYVVLTDADNTETTINALEKTLDTKLTCHKHNVMKKDFVGREAYFYETKADVLIELQKALDENKRCLVIVDDKNYLHETAQKRLINLPDNACFFSRDTEAEESHIEFRKNPREFAENTNLLFCTPILKSGVSFVNSFDEVFSIVLGSSFVSRDIVQFLSRERHWKRAHIFTNTLTIPVPKPVESPTPFDEATVMIQEDVRQQLLVRPYDTAVRLDARGAKVTFIKGDPIKVKQSTTQTPPYRKVGEDGRSTYSKEVFKIVNGFKWTKADNLVTKYESLASKKGFSLHCPLAFYDWVQKDQMLKASLGQYFSKFSKSLESLGISDGGFFNNAPFTSSKRPKQKGKLAAALEGYSLDSDGYRKEKERLNKHDRLLDLIDQNPKRFELESDIVDAHETLEEVADL
jgi:hypothetical protein